ncbi:phage tail protein [Anaplasma capra]|uniref:phage tail protein n=1 Tax=Anaplasma capra TaxID=1562740 RepID=UPI0021D58DA5|nr:phage tail protein [Anaplasma capra]MCU7611668.1 phage tail protein [Anaplasma capra]MCU7612183.1 phage tail protein [Anaplasma capra]
MIILKFKERSGGYVTLQGIQNVRLTLRSKNYETRSVLSGGWKDSLNGAGDRNVTVRVGGLLLAGQSTTDSILLQHSFESSTLDCELLLDGIRRERVIMKCFVELYERYYAAGNLNGFNVTLTSNGLIEYYREVKSSNVSLEAKI